jgi:tetratricopeptide (TPR) repeat protein
MSASSVRAKWALPLALAAALTASHSASAQTATATPQADSLFAEGRDLLEKGRYADACPKLARSEQLSPAVGTLLNLGYCYEQLGKLRSAMDAYAEAEKLASAAGDPKRATFAKDRYVVVEPRAPKLVVRIVPPEAPGVEVKRNGVAMTKTELDHAIAVDPQDYVLTASANGYVTWKSAIVVRGEGAVVMVTVPPLEVHSAAPAGVAAEASSITPRRIVALGLGAVSALAIGAGIAAGLSAKSRYDDASPHCDDRGCDDVGTSIQHGAVVQGNIATALVALGLLSGGGAIYLWIVGAPDTKRTARSVRVDVSPFGAALGGSF